MSNSGSAHVGGGAGAGKVNVQDISVTKYVDSSSPKLMLACCNGTHYANALLTVRKAGGDAPVDLEPDDALAGAPLAIDLGLAACHFSIPSSPPSSAGGKPFPFPRPLW